MYFAVITLLVLPSSVVLGNHWRFETQGASCPPDENCKYITSCPGAKARFWEGDPPTICGWKEAIPMVCCSNYAEGILLLNSTINENPAPNVNPERNENQRSRNMRFNPRLSSISETGCGRRESLTSYNAGRYPTYYAGGVNTIWRWPWMAEIFIRYGETPHCGATLIDERHILTAAHCFADRSLNPQDYIVGVGETDITSSTIRYRIQEIRLHEAYTPKYHYNDIAIIRLAQAVRNRSDSVCILEKDNLQEGDGLTGLGWGRLSYGGHSANTLQVASGIPIVGNRACNTKYQRVSNAPYPNGITTDFICAGLKEGGLDACQGDSGGPLVYEFTEKQWALVGIVSFGFKCGEPDFPGVYTRVSSFLPWITQYIQNQRRSGR